jgi:probable HAF family extracellular repeat protein
MKSRYFASALAATLAACGGPSHGSIPQTALPQATGAPLASDHSIRESVTYKVLELPTLGGTQAFANWINDRGWVAGAADLTGGRDEHAFVWHDSKIHDLGTLGGKNSLAWPVNDRGTVGGDSDTSTNDPLKENFCHFVIDGKAQFTKHTCSGYVLLGGVMTALPTLGGNNSQVFGMNSRGEIVGVAENTTHDPACIAPQVLDFEAVVWAPKSRQIKQLPPLEGDVIGGAIAVNERGDVVGASGMCAPISPAIGAHALLWHNGKPKNLGGFGGQTSNVAWDISNRGHIVGFSDLTGDTATHAFLWKNGKMTDLGTLPGDVFSFAFGINERDQIVGESCDASFNCRAFIWQDGVMHDLNALVPGSSLSLTLAESINQNGEITGIAYDPTTGGIPAYVAIPRGDGLDATPRSKTVLPADVRIRIQQMSLSGRFRAPSFSRFLKQSELSSSGHL